MMLRVSGGSPNIICSSLGLTNERYYTRKEVEEKSFIIFSFLGLKMNRFLPDLLSGLYGHGFIDERFFLRWIMFPQAVDLQ